MPTRRPGEQLSEADLQGASEPDYREDPEVAGAALEIDKIASAHRRPVTESLLREIRPAASALDVLPQAAERWVRLEQSALAPETKRRSSPRRSRR